MKMLSSYRAIIILTILNNVVLAIGLLLMLYGMWVGEGFKQAIGILATKCPTLLTRDVQPLVDVVGKSSMFRGIGIGISILSGLNNIILWKAIRDMMKLAKISAKVIKK